MQRAGTSRAIAFSISQSRPLSFQHHSIAIPTPSLNWHLAASYKAGMNAGFSIRNLLAIQDFLMGKLLGEDIQDIDFCGLGLYQTNSFLISNLGVFGATERMDDGGWGIEEVGISTESIRAAIGDIGKSFNVASDKSGDCVVCTTWEEGVLEEEMVERGFEGVRGCLQAVIQTP